MSYRLAHMLIASFLTVSFLIAGVSAFRWLVGGQTEGVRVALRTGVFAAAALIPVQIHVGNLHGLNTKEHQPAKITAMAGHWETGGDVPLPLFAIPDQAAHENHAEIAILNLASIILTHKADAWHLSCDPCRVAGRRCQCHLHAGAQGEPGRRSAAPVRDAGCHRSGVMDDVCRS